MIVIRSLLFQVLLYAWTASITVLLTPMLFISRRAVMWGARLWIRVAFALARLVVGLRYEVRGREHIPQGAAIVAPKHQSMWDTMVFHLLLPNPSFVLKKELISIPFFGWHLKRAGSIPVDRKGGARALKHMAEATRRALADGQQVVIFPEGTRTTPGSTVPYQTGIGLLYGLGAPVVPVALNSGLFWGRHTFLRKPGTIVVEFLPPLPQGLDRRAVIGELQARIEGACRTLTAEPAAA